MLAEPTRTKEQKLSALKRSLAQCKTTSRDQALEIMTLKSRVSLLEEQNARLLSAQEFLDSLDNENEAANIGLLGPGQRDIYNILFKYKGTMVNYNSIGDYLYGHLPECDQPEWPMKSIKVMVRYLRKQLPNTHKILNTRGNSRTGGYALVIED